MPRRASTHVDDPVAVGRRIREARERAGVSQSALSFPGCTTAYISRIEAGKRIPSLQILREIGRRLDVSAEYLATGQASTSLSDDPVTDAELALRFDDPQSAKERFEAIAARSGTPQVKARALAGLGHVAFDAGDHETAIVQFRQALELWPALASEPALADSLGRAYAMTSRYEEAMAIFQRMLDRARERQDLLETIRFSVLLANTLTDRGRFGHAEEILAEAISLSDSSHDPLVRARVWWTQARLHTLQNDSARAERYARMALESLTETEHVRYVAAAHQTLALIKLDQDEPEEALDLLERGFPLVLEGGNGYQQALYWTERARALTKLDRLDEAQENAERALALLEGASPADASRVQAVIGEIHERRGDVEAAVEAYREAAERAPVTARYKLETYARLAEVLKRAGRSDEALEVLTEAVNIQASLARD